MYHGFELDEEKMTVPTASAEAVADLDWQMYAVSDDTSMIRISDCGRVFVKREAYVNANEQLLEN
jgi:hypothetical protein